MNIDWLTVIAQVINFLVLVWLLKIFLYKPVLEAMDRREQLISARLEQAQQREQEAEEAGNSYRNLQQSLLSERNTLIENAVSEAHIEHQRLLENARKEASEQKEKWQSQTKAELRQFTKDVGICAAQNVQKTTKQVLSILANSSLDTEIINSFIQKLSKLAKDEKSELASHSGAFHITTACTLSDESQHHLVESIHDIFANNNEIVFHETADMIGGIELQTPNHLLGWSLKACLDKMEHTILDELEHSNALV